MLYEQAIPLLISEHKNDQSNPLAKKLETIQVCIKGE
jgi:hypothetical protein